MNQIRYLVLIGCIIYSKAQQPILHLASFNNQMIPHVLQVLSNEQNNIVYSPFGLATSLSVVFEGLDDKIATDLFKTLGLGNPKTTRENLRLGIKLLLEYMQAQMKKNTDGTTGSFSHAQVNSPEKLIPQFENLLKQYYKIDINNNITSDANELIFEQITDTKVMGHWKDFDKLAVYTYLTHQPSVPFMTHDGDVVAVPMIPQVGLFKAGYHPKLSSQIIELPLEHEVTNLVLVMPDNKDGLSDMLTKMTQIDLTQLTKNMPMNEVEVALPQFAIISSDIDLGRILKKSGLNLIFLKSDKIKRGNTRYSFGGEGPLKSIKQNSYFATSFTSVNSVGTTTSILYKKIKSKKLTTTTPIYEVQNDQNEDIQNEDTQNKDIQNEDIQNEDIQNKNIQNEDIQNEETTEYSQDDHTENYETTETQESSESSRKKRASIQTYSFNKPFIFLIYHAKSGIVLLAGAVKRPTQVPNP